MIDLCVCVYFTLLNYEKVDFIIEKRSNINAWYLYLGVHISRQASIVSV